MRSLTILYVEDHKLLLIYIKGMLESQGWRVQTCEDGRSALARIESAHPYDLLLLDNSLPGISGLELVRRARSLTHHRRTPIIIILSAGDSAKAALRAGADLSLKKPEEVDGIVATITRLMQER